MRLSEEQWQQQCAKRERWRAGTPVQPADAQQSLLALRAVTLTLPMPVSVNDAWHPLPSGGKALTAPHREFRKLVRREVGTRMPLEQPFAGRIRLRITLGFANRRRTDIDNRVKPIQDALTCAKVWFDDSQVDELVVERVYVMPGTDEACHVHIEEIAA